MDSSTSSKVETMKPFLFKAGITLTLSLAAFVYARIVAKRSNLIQNSALETNVDSLETDSQSCCDDASFHSLCSAYFDSIESDEPLAIGTNFEEELLGLKDRFEDLQNRERELEIRFIKYIDLKEQESVLFRTREVMTCVDFLNKEISLMEDENRRVEKFLVEYLRVLKKLEYWESQTGFLQRQVKKLLRRTKVQSHLVQERDSKIRAKEAELLRAREALGTSINDVKMLESELSELRIVLSQLQEEKNQLLTKLELEQRSASSFSSIIEAEKVVTTEEHNKLANELAELKIDRATEVKELIYLRWCNACLKHKLMKIEEQCEEQNYNVENIGNFGPEPELDNGIVLGHDGNENGDQLACSKRKSLLKKVRKWVEGCEKGKEKVDVEKERESHEVKCLRRHSVSYEQNEHCQGRWSCSSAC